MISSSDKNVPRINSWYTLRRKRKRKVYAGHRPVEKYRGARGEQGAQRQPQPLQLLPRSVTLAKSYCEDSRSKNQLETSKHWHHNHCRYLSRASAQVTIC
eukprot:358203-Pelagomonas_calceolata.AAC.1